jgi:imidazolonepropionase-like amidohydrolase
MLQVLRGATLIDGTRAPPRRATVVVDAPRIVAVLDATPGDPEGFRPETLPAPFAALDGLGETLVYDATGLTILPGLIDAHDHMSHLSAAGWLWSRRTAPSTSIGCRWRPRRRSPRRYRSTP